MVAYLNAALEKYVLKEFQRIQNKRLLQWTKTGLLPLVLYTSSVLRGFILCSFGAFKKLKYLKSELKVINLRDLIFHYLSLQ